MTTSALRKTSLVLGATMLCAAFSASADDDICSQIAKFALATSQTSSHSVELQNDWGNLSKYCGYNDYAPGKVFCGWLIQNTSTEFMHANVNDALACISSDASAIGIPKVTPDYLSGKYSSFSARHLSADYEVTIECSIGIKDKADTLKIVVAKEDWQ